ncbi:hypothetical protein OG800_45710 [Streptomyces sp. NBC_00445]|uniref:hypothetical protein n=1 Tax=unclassified Streptomyces TaxID=2593676 RepID=UPI002E1F1F10|nr:MULTISPECIES: hypothetical protein [unclassified Streptomyces]
MARFKHPVSRTRAPGPGLVWAVLLAVLVILLSPPALSSTHPSAPGGALLAAEQESAHGEPYADSPDPAASTAVVRSHRDATGERHVPPVSAPGASPDTATDPLRPAQPPVSAAGPPASEQPALRHGMRAPPSLSGI